MASITVNSRQDNINGHIREIILNADISDAQTFDTKMTNVLNVQAQSSAGVAAGHDMRWSVSGSTVTFKTEAAETGARVVISGF